MAETLHVLTLTPFYPTAQDDASGCFISEPLDWLARGGVRNTVIAMQPFYRGKVPVRSRRESTQWFRYFAWPGGFGLPSAGAFAFARIVAWVRELHRANRIDLVHAHGPLPCGHVAMLLHAEFGLPYVISVHGLDAFSAVQVHGWAGAWCRGISQRVYASSQRVICVSERVRENVLEGMGRRCRTSVVYNGVDPNRFSPGASPSQRPLVLSIGNLIPIKGHDLLIRAMAALLPEYPDLSLEIIGDGPERVPLETLAKQNRVFDQVRFCGRQPRKQTAEAVAACTVFALPSRYEALGCVFLEAMSAGKAVIGCRGQGIAEIIRHGSNGFLVGPDNEKELVIALGMLLRDENLRRSLGAAARDTVLDRFTLAHQAEKLARIYRESVR
jgi:teichuronic acid biosynthesis glycosyltransferase TuaC